MLRLWLQHVLVRHSGMIPDLAKVCTDIYRFFYYWSFDRKTLLDDEAKAQKLISVNCTKQLISLKSVCILGKCATFHTFQAEMHAFRKTLARYGNSLVYLFLVT